MVHTTYITPKKPVPTPASTLKPAVRKKKHVTVSLYTPPRPPIRVNEIFLNICRKEYSSVEVVMNTGEIIEGIIDCYDADTIVLHNDMAQMLIYKNSISYISPRNGKHVIFPDKHLCYSDQFTFERNTPCTSPSMRQSSSSNGIGS